VIDRRKRRKRRKKKRVEMTLVEKGNEWK